MTTDADALTNSIMMDIEKAFRKEGIGGVTHRHYEGNRKVIKGLVAIMLAEELEAEKEK